MRWFSLAVVTSYVLVAAMAYFFY